MTEGDSTRADVTLEAYVDGLLGPAEREAFERRAEGDTALRAELRRQGTLDEGLRRLAAAPSMEHVVEQLQRSAEMHGGKAPGFSRARPGRRRFLVAGAAIAATVFAGWRLWDYYVPKADPYAAQPWRSLHTVYRDVIANDFRPDWICEDDQEFAEAFQKRLGVRLLLDQSDPAVQAGGVGYCNSISPNTMYVLARVAAAPESCSGVERGEAAKVIVFVDRARSDSEPAVPPDGPLQLFRRELKKLVVYELTPCHRPYVLDRLYVPETADE